MNIETKSKINSLLMNLHPGGLLFSEGLKKLGYSDQLMKQYRNSGWLTSLSKGVMYRSGDSLSALAALANCQEQTGKQYRVAAHSALELSGYYHFVPMGKPKLMVASNESRIPQWAKSDLFDMTIEFFTTSAFGLIQEQTLKQNNYTIQASIPELAFMECLLLAPSRYSYMDLYYIMEQLTAVRPAKVQQLLEATNNLTVKRMFLYMAEKANYPWFQSLDLDHIDLGTSKIQLCKGGVYVSKYKITIPRELVEYE
jgi:hypothetical protein